MILLTGFTKNPNYCPCCSGVLLKHIRTSHIYWFCRNCWQEMPVILGKNSSHLSTEIPGVIPSNLGRKEHNHPLRHLNQK